MAATAWVVWNRAKRNIGNGTIVLGTGITKIQLHQTGGATNQFSTTIALSTAASIVTAGATEVITANGYTVGGKSLLSMTWTAGSAATQIRFDAADPIWTATGGTISTIKYALLRNSTGAGAGKVICWSKLTTAAFNLTVNNTLTIQMAAAGIFNLS